MMHWLLRHAWRTDTLRIAACPIKRLDLMDEAAAKLRVALYSMPPELKEMKAELDRLQAEEDAASNSRDYQRAAEIKVERLRKDEEYHAKRDKWESEHHSTKLWISMILRKSFINGRAFPSAR